MGCYEHYNAYSVAREKSFAEKMEQLKISTKNVSLYKYRFFLEDPRMNI